MRLSPKGERGEGGAAVGRWTRHGGAERDAGERRGMIREGRFGG